LSNPTSLIEEMAAAARGTVALLMGDRRAPSHFDFSARGLAGSAIAFLATVLLNAVLPHMLGAAEATPSVAYSVLLTLLLYGLQIGCSALVLRQLNRLDGLLPYLVADNWFTFFAALLSTAVALLGISADVALVAMMVLLLVVEINIARLIVTLAPRHVALFIVAQLVGVSIGFLVLISMMPTPPGLTPPA